MLGGVCVFAFKIALITMIYLYHYVFKRKIGLADLVFYKTLKILIKNQEV